MNTKRVMMAVGFALLMGLSAHAQEMKSDSTQVTVEARNFSLPEQCTPLYGGSILFSTVDAQITEKKIKATILMKTGAYLDGTHFSNEYTQYAPKVSVNGVFQIYSNESGVAQGLISFSPAVTQALVSQFGLSACVSSVMFEAVRMISDHGGTIAQVWVYMKLNDGQLLGPIVF